MQFFAMTILILFVILSRAKDLGDSTTVNNSTTANSLCKILHCVQNDKEESFIIHLVIPRRGNREAVGSTLLLCPDVGIYRCLWASQSERARVSAMLNYKGRLPQNCIERREYPQGPVMQFFAMTILIHFVILSKAKDLWDSTTFYNSTTDNSHREILHCVQNDI